MIIGIVIVIAQGDVVTTDVVFKPVLPTYITPDFSFAHSLSVALPFSGDDGIAKRTGYRSNESSWIFGSRFAINCIYWIAGTGFSPFGVYSVGIAAITAAICQSPEAHPDKDQRWLAAAVAGIFYLLAGLFGSAITGMMAALPVSWIQMLAGLALLSTIGGSLYQALHNERERRRGGGGISGNGKWIDAGRDWFCVLGINCRRRLLRGVEFNR